ncbi:MAG: hypothetical protein SWY16_19160 [Cyanobacteriota bacterium]|nr:hypothetical protein [Cyanobacteriota bacterium]
MTEPKLPHSKMGIASFCISLLLLFSILFGAPIDTYRNTVESEFLVLAFIGIGLAVAGMFAKQRNRLFPILGLIVSSACLLTSLVEVYAKSS